MQLARRPLVVAATAVALLGGAAHARAFSVLSHEATIDVAWDQSIKPLLLARFPRTTADDLDCARSYAYGGSVIQDLGYYPFGNTFFSNLVHYTRSGDFVETMLREAQNVDELAFALGALAHYADDNTGHPLAVNRAVPIIFPKLRKKYGNVVTYEQGKKQHVIVEFSFDVAHTARSAYPLSTYRNLIGFRVATPLLERAFRDTYDLDLNEEFSDLEKSISTYRYAVSQIIPALTKEAWREKHSEIEKANPKTSQQSFVLVYGRAAYEKDYGSNYQKPKLFARFIAFLYRFIPKIGPLKPLSFKVPTPEADSLFVRSVSEANTRFARAIADYRGGSLDLRNTDFDTGAPSQAGEYGLADETYAELLKRLAKKNFDGVEPALRRNIAAFYRSGKEPAPRNKKERKERELIDRELAELAAH